ncbi:MAG: long-chain fatty acid--CoA ligase [Fimbriimonadaceae bacterium]|jgi:long-chain acyl-CoA synthetase|nr:long-chain fatty acid--CoA ligase [Fimbriimonadaceae bacterium]
MPHIKDAKSLGDMVRRTVEKFPQRTSHMIPGKEGYTSKTYTEFWEDVYGYARALDSFGLQKGDKLVLLGDSCYEWAITDWAAQTLGVVIVPIYPTLPPDQAQYIAQDCEAKAAVCLNAQAAAKLRDIPTLLLRPASSEVGIKDWIGKGTLTKEAWNKRIDEVDMEDLATLIYTSGTTGQPKGAILPHRCFISLIPGIRETIPVTEEDVWLSFLPLSHVFERFAGHALPTSIGACIAYAGSVASLAGDIQKVKPTMMMCVPRFLENIRAKVIENVGKQPALRQKLFYACLSQGAKKRRGESAPFAGLLDKLVGAKIRERLGGRMRLLVAGGAALAPHVSEFYMAFNLTVCQGYGLTETCAASSVNHPERNKPWTVGEPLQGVEIKIAPDGEILIRGNSVMNGYFNLPGETAAAIDSEGWFHTGDIGEFEGKHLKITDRKKDLLVLGNGKNVAPQMVENRLKESEYINEVVLIGDGMEYCAALIVPEFDRVKAWLAAKGETISDTAGMIEREDVRALFKSEVDVANKQLADFEKVKRHVLLPKAFSVDDGELTPSLKVRRKVVKDKYAAQVKSLQRS